MKERKALSKRVRFEIFKRDRFACVYCGRTPPAVLLHIDHVHPLAAGGTDEAENLVTACADCNLGKAAKLLSDVPQSLSDQVQDREERAAQLRAFNELLMQLRQEEEETIAELGRYWFNSFVAENARDRWVFGVVRQRDIRGFLRTLAPTEILEAMDIAMKNLPAKWWPPASFKDDGTWRYFCGVCWRMIRERGGPRA